MIAKLPIKEMRVLVTACFDYSLKYGVPLPMMIPKYRHNSLFALGLQRGHAKGEFFGHPKPGFRLTDFREGGA